mmetsp:Transcript_3810/g.11639  ORF Transcript_3810/g.11639 Transcript_3810/m.11639 type:complete len:273 (+) Transcript_3810:1502-2320(+)
MVGPGAADQRVADEARGRLRQRDFWGGEEGERGHFATCLRFRALAFPRVRRRHDAGAARARLARLPRRGALGGRRLRRLRDCRGAVVLSRARPAFKPAADVEAQGAERAPQHRPRAVDAHRVRPALHRRRVARRRGRVPRRSHRAGAPTRRLRASRLARLLLHANGLVHHASLLRLLPLGHARLREDVFFSVSHHEVAHPARARLVRHGPGLPANRVHEGHVFGGDERGGVGPLPRDRGALWPAVHDQTDSLYGHDRRLPRLLRVGHLPHDP